MRPLHVIAESALPEPIGAARLLHRDGRRLLATGESGRLYRLDIDPEHLSVRALKTRVILDASKITMLSASDDFARLLVAKAGAGIRVLDVAAGAELFRDASPANGWAILPDGSTLVHVLTAETRAVLLDDPDGAGAPPPFTTWHYAHEPRTTDHGEGEPSREETYHSLERAGDVVIQPLGGELGLYRVFIGCYGFAVAHLATRIPPFGRVPGHSHVFGDFVYDPVRLVGPYGCERLFAIEGGGLGLSALEPDSGEQEHFPVRRGRGFIDAVVPCAGTPEAWVRTAEGPYWWSLRQGATRLPREATDVVALYPNLLLCNMGAGRLVWATA